jgi:hypothetical protein
MQVDIKYRYAKNSGGSVIDIDSVDKSSRRQETYTCLACYGDLNPIQGTQRIWHFRHKSDTDCVNAGETYLHELAKLLFFETFKECRATNTPFRVKYSVPVNDCTNRAGDGPCTARYHREFDLTQIFDSIEIEKRHNGFVPDLLLRGGDDVLYVEICVNHGCEREKINAGTAILELVVSTEERDNSHSVRIHNGVSRTDEDFIESKIVTLIKSCLFDLSQTPCSSMVKLHHIDYGAPGRSNCQKSCRKNAEKGSRPDNWKSSSHIYGESSTPSYELTEGPQCYFIVLDGGKCAIKYFLARQYDELQRKGHYIVQIDGKFNLKELAHHTEQAYKQGNVITDCWLCRQHIHDGSNGRSYCMQTNARLFPDFQAMRCRFYTDNQMSAKECTELHRIKIEAFNKMRNVITIDPANQVIVRNTKNMP